MQTVKHVVISAAGLGSRLELDMPKCLVEVGGRKLIDYQLDLLAEIEDVRIVVGFREEEVIDHIRKIRDDVIFVRNPDYQTTTNSYSVYLGSRNLQEPFITLDGDLLIEPRSFEDFLRQCGKGKSIVGITKTKTEEAVFVEIDETEHIIAFQRERRSDFEWTGIAYLDGIKIVKDAGYIYHVIEKHLPLKAFEISCHEIDTPQDLAGAHEFLRTLETNS